MLVNRHRKGKKPPEDSDEGSNGTHPRRSERYKPSKHHGEEDSPPRHDRPKEGDYSPVRRHSNRHKALFTKRIV